MANEFLLVSQFLTAAVMLALAGWLLYLKWASPVNRAFALFLILRAIQIAFLRFAGLADSPEMQHFWNVSAEYLFLVIPFALLHFLVAYIRPPGARWYQLTFMAAGLAVMLLYLSNHCLSQCTDADGLTQLGPLSVFSHGAPFAMGLVGVGIALGIRFGSNPAQTMASALVAASFVLNAVFDSLLAISGIIRLGWAEAIAPYVANAWQSVAWLNFALALLPGLVGFVVLLSVYQRRGEMSNQGSVFVLATVLALVSAAFVGFFGPAIGVEWSLFVVGLWRLVPSAFIAYALLRHRFIDIDLRVKYAVKSSTIAAFPAVAFFIGSEVIENFIDLPGIVLGVMAAAAIALVLRPIQKLANRLAEKAFPHTKPTMELSKAERESMFLEQAQLVWMDGVVGHKERVLLDKLQSRLDISADVAKSLEQEAAQDYQRRIQGVSA